MRNKEEALIIVDVQNDFLPGGALEVKDGDQIIPVINKLQKEFELIVATQDFHPAVHKSFAANHEGKKVGEFVKLGGLDQFLWPVHCVQGSEGSSFEKHLDKNSWAEIFQKGKNPEVDSYSGFFDNARKGDTGLGDYLKDKGVKSVYITGLALDYCVKFTAMDAINLGFKTFLVEDASRAVNITPEDGANALKEMKEAGILIVTSQEIL